LYLDLPGWYIKIYPPITSLSQCCTEPSQSFAYFNILKEPTVLMDKEPTASRQIYGRSFEFNFFQQVFLEPWLLPELGLWFFWEPGFWIIRVALITFRGVCSHF
jgi:hypothetical protein